MQFRLTEIAIVVKEGKQLATSRECKFIETSSGLKHNVDELLVGVLKQIRLRESRKKKLRRQGSKSKLMSKLHNSKTVLSLNIAREILNKICLNDSKSKSCENLHVLWNITLRNHQRKARRMERNREIPFIIENIDSRIVSTAQKHDGNQDQEVKRSFAAEGCITFLFFLIHANENGATLARLRPFQQGRNDFTICTLITCSGVPVRRRCYYLRIPCSPFVMLCRPSFCSRSSDIMQYISIM